MLTFIKFHVEDVRHKVAEFVFILLFVVFSTLRAHKTTSGDAGHRALLAQLMPFIA